MLCALNDVKAWLSLTDRSITGITKGNPAIVTSANHNLINGRQIIINGVTGMTQINGQTVTVQIIDANTFSIGIDSTLYSSYVSGGIFYPDDIQLTNLINASSNEIENYCSRIFAQQSYTEQRCGHDGRMMSVLNPPINSVASLTIYDHNTTIVIPACAGNVPVGQGYTFQDEYISLHGYLYCRGRDNVVIAYSGGYATIPQDIVQACIDLVALKYTGRMRIGHKSKSLANEVVTFMTEEMPDHIKAVCERYRRRIPA
jgi:Ubiquitin-activating enzyme E1 FCCH domain